MENDVRRCGEVDLDVGVALVILDQYERFRTATKEDRVVSPAVEARLITQISPIIRETAKPAAR